MKYKIKSIKMRKFFCFIVFLISFNNLTAHDIDYEKIILKKWVLAKEDKIIEGSFSMYKNGDVFIEDAEQHLIHYPLSSFSPADQDFVVKKYENIIQINKQLEQSSTRHTTVGAHLNIRFWIIICLLSLLGLYTFLLSEKKKRIFLSPVFFIGTILLLYGFSDDDIKMRLLTTTDPVYMDSAFTPFKPKIFTHWDNTYFYVESKGIADHEMMIGIRAWQQQVPIPQCYTVANNNNAWSIPLNPVISSNPIPVDTVHFLRGAIALAVNGIPIFNYHTNTGVDSYTDGQLDNFGGHCGRADDYHYHIAPLILYNQIAANKPVAYALDGFAVYGAQEPEGTPMTTLDANHGHYGRNGVYHYHGTPPAQGAPYMIGNMVGVVTEDTTHQIIPQAAAKSPRPALTPLSGAVITGCQPNNSNNGYNLTYTNGGLTYHVNYFWADTTNNRSKYTFDFVSLANTTESIYLGTPSQSSCIVPTVVIPVVTTVKKTMKRLPDTGETLGYTTTFGEDNDYAINAPYFINNGNGTVTDTITGLMWQKVDGGEMTFEKAVLYCDTLTLGGYTDWRLPNPHEGFSILNLQNVNPAIDGNAFTASGAAAEYWWTNAKQFNDSTKVWCTNSGGGIGNKPKAETISAGGTKSYHVRALRDVATPATVLSQFANNLDGTITDNLTNLVWQKIPYADSLTWENALIYADSLTLAGYLDWRLPNIKELQSINDESKINPSIDTIFKVINNKKYWSGTSLPNHTTQAWYLNSQYGITTYDEKIRRDLVLCVRGTSNVTTQYIFNGNGNWDKTINWLNYTIPPTTLPSGFSIIINPLSGGQCTLNTTQHISQGANITVSPGKNFLIPGSLIQQ